MQPEALTAFATSLTVIQEGDATTRCAATWTLTTTRPTISNASALGIGTISAPDAGSRNTIDRQESTDAGVVGAA